MLPLFLGGGGGLIIGRRWWSGSGWRDYCRWNAPDFPAAAVAWSPWMAHYGRSGEAGVDSITAGGTRPAVLASIHRSDVAQRPPLPPCAAAESPPLARAIQSTRHPFFPSAFRLSSTAHAAAAAVAGVCVCARVCVRDDAMIATTVVYECLLIAVHGYFALTTRNNCKYWLKLYSRLSWTEKFIE